MSTILTGCSYRACGESFPIFNSKFVDNTENWHALSLYHDGWIDVIDNISLVYE